MSSGIDYIESGLESGTHTAVYKMHRYFARRPHNVMKALIEQYSNPGDIILDCYSGGGVTLFEGLATGRKVFAVDVNPLACFIADCQTTNIDLAEYEVAMQSIRTSFDKWVESHYSTECRLTGRKVPIRWTEMAYIVKCPNCTSHTSLANDFKTVKDGEYHCNYCDSVFKAADTPRIDSELLSVIYTCPETGNRVAHPPTEKDIEKSKYFEDNFDKLIEQNELWYPLDSIPEEWDRQHEDCLHKKGFSNFSDLFTKRALFHNAILYQLFTDNNSRYPPELKKILLFTFSAILRYTNNMTYSTPNWQDGRPVAWDKHAYWTPNQFVEVNPMEYFDKRFTAIKSGMKHQQREIESTSQVFTFNQLLNGGTHIVLNTSSDVLPIPDSSIKAVITDPPYGSNVQYGELCHFWLVWLREHIETPLFDLDKEILVHRKKKDKNQKTFADYGEGLTRVFREVYRVLVPNGVLTFTFNSKNFQAWYALVKAAVDAGFKIEPGAMIYQEPIANYRQTAHSRFKGTAQGDFIYSFIKDDLISQMIDEDSMVVTDIKSEIKDAIIHSIENGYRSTESIQIEVMQLVMPSLLSIAKSGLNLNEFRDVVNAKELESILNEICVLNEESGLWKLKE